MGLRRITEKLDEYFVRLESGTAARIKPAHVATVIAKLEAKQDQLKSEFENAEKASKRERLENKISTVRGQIERAQWLLKRIGSPPET